MRTPSTAVRGVFVIIIILGVVFISNIGIVQSGARELQLEESTATPTATPAPDIPLYFPLLKNNHGSLYGSVTVATGQGFDHCFPLSIEGMQEWWDHSPYSVVNIYLGGISALCPFDELDIDWYTQVAGQGWSFILTWAGPQAPKGCPDNCKFSYPMSTDPQIAYLEGKLEALAAVETAENIGFKEQLVIYYDVESYSGADEDTKATVASFIKGWTEQLHELGHIAAAYGAACTSYVVDWAFNDPPLDAVWVAQWNKEYIYDPDADVYNTTCLDNSGQPPIFWINHQRLKQYTGPHNETWGDLTVKIDSDVLDGPVNTLFGQPPGKSFDPGSATQADQPHVQSSGPNVREMQLLSATAGWVLLEDQLLWTADSGITWHEITPNTSNHSDVLGVHFSDQKQGWAAVRNLAENGSQSLSIFQTKDTGETWIEIPQVQFSPAETWELASASFDFLNDEVGWLSLELHSGRNFSFGRLLATEDGGKTWQERNLPLGEPVVFIDALNGWVFGGPLNQVYHTADGGYTWSITEKIKPQVAKDLAFTDPHFEGAELPQGVVILDSFDSQYGWAFTQESSCTGYKLRVGEQLPAGVTPLQCESTSSLVRTIDGGKSWDEITLPN